jgi:hypothetical protein
MWTRTNKIVVIGIIALLVIVGGYFLVRGNGGGSSDTYTHGGYVVQGGETVSGCMRNVEKAYDGAYEDPYNDMPPHAYEVYSLLNDEYDDYFSVSDLRSACEMEING